MNTPDQSYGSHSYTDHGVRRHCLYHCGCWKQDSMAGGPVGLDPDGECPNNPTSTQLSPKQDYENVVNRRIAELTERAETAEAKLKLVNPSKNKMALIIIRQNGELEHLRRLVKDIHEMSAP